MKYTANEVDGDPDQKCCKQWCTTKVYDRKDKVDEGDDEDKEGEVEDHDFKVDEHDLNLEYEY